MAAEIAACNPARNVPIQSGMSVPERRFGDSHRNRCFPSKAIRGWLYAIDEQRAEIVASYFRMARGWGEPIVDRRTSPLHQGDPLFAGWAHR